MKYLSQFAIIMAVSLLGEILSFFIPLGVPASVYGMIIMFLLLQGGVIKLSQIRETGKFLLEIMGIMFVPAVAGVIEFSDTLLSSLPLFVCVVASTAVVMAVAGKVTDILLGRKRGDR